MPTAGQVIQVGRLPNERIATEIVTADSAGVPGGNQIEVASVTAPLIAGRVYRVRASGAIRGTTAEDNGQLLIFEDSAVGSQFQNRAVGLQDPTTNVGYEIEVEAEHQAVATANKTFVLMLRGFGSNVGDVILEAGSTTPVYLYVDYIRG